MNTKNTIAMFLIVSSMLVVMAFADEPQDLVRCLSLCTPECLRENPSATPPACDIACRQICTIIIRNGQDPGSPFSVEKINRLLHWIFTFDIYLQPAVCFALQLILINKFLWSYMVFLNLYYINSWRLSDEFFKGCTV